MTFSVWNHGDRLYDYYGTPTASSRTSAPKPEHLRSTTLGMTPETAAWPLPASARWMGRGRYPKGSVANANGGSSLGIPPFDLTGTNILLVGALGLMVYHFLWKPAMKGR